MSRRRAHLVILCEDKQQETFIRRFLKKMGWKRHELRAEIAPPGTGAAEQYVREHYPNELNAYRSQRPRDRQRLVVMLDGDRFGVAGRLEQFKVACRDNGISNRSDADHVAIFVPAWNIEAWLAYLDGDTVDENRRDYRRLARPRDCRRHVDRLAEMCERQALREPAPASLKHACEEYEQRLT